LRWPRNLVDEAVWVGAEGVIEGLLARGMDLVGLAIMDLIGGHQADTQMMVVLVVPVEEGSAEGLGVLDGAEPLGELGLVFQGLEAAFGEGVVVGVIGPAVGLVTPRSASSRAVAFAFIDGPRSACRVSWSGGTA
jgi:hypothetical protein